MSPALSWVVLIGAWVATVVLSVLFIVLIDKVGRWRRARVRARRRATWKEATP